MTIYRSSFISSWPYNFISQALNHIYNINIFYLHKYKWLMNDQLKRSLDSILTVFISGYCSINFLNTWFGNKLIENSKASRKNGI